MKLPLLMSVPHAGERIPPEALPFCILTPDEVVRDSDEGAREIYSLEDEVEAYHTTSIARAIIDPNRPEDDRRRDGVVKTHTCWDVPVYDRFPPEEVIETLLERYHRPYHRRLRELAGGKVRLGVDCHTMAAHGPPVGPDPGRERPAVCLGNADGTCPADWLEELAAAFSGVFGLEVARNRPFRGGFIIRSHSGLLPWVQIELSRAGFLSNAQKRQGVREALRRFCRKRF